MCCVLRMKSCSCLWLKKESAISSREAVIKNGIFIFLSLDLYASVTFLCFTFVHAHCSFMSQTEFSETHPDGIQCWKKLQGCWHKTVNHYINMQEHVRQSSQSSGHLQSSRNNRIVKKLTPPTIYIYVCIYTCKLQGRVWERFAVI